MANASDRPVDPTPAGALDRFENQLDRFDRQLDHLETKLEPIRDSSLALMSADTAAPSSPPTTLADKVWRLGIRLDRLDRITSEVSL